VNETGGVIAVASLRCGVQQRGIRIMFASSVNYVVEIKYD
jgi:hypothetical protein